MEKIYTGIGKRKTSVAKAYLNKGTGYIAINGKEFSKFFYSNKGDEEKIKAPLTLLKIDDLYNINVFVKGGGVSSRIEAIRLAVAKSIVALNPNYKKELKVKTFLTSDSRIKESRKYGLKKARKAPQYTKR